MAESIGTAYLNIEVRTDNMQAGLSTAKRSVSDMSQQAQAEYNKLTAAQKRVADSAVNYAKTMGLAREEVRALNVEQRIGGHLGKELAASIRAQAAAQRTATAGMAMSAKQTQAALRGVPAQITDIVTSLQGGQRPITVLLQQGGQLKDMFGGIRPAAAALGSTILGMVNPVTVAAAAAVGLGLAWKSVSDEAESLSRALIVTGGHAGATAAQLDLIADAIARGKDTYGAAADVVAKVVATGRFTGEQIRQVSEAALAAQRDLGVSVEETIAKFVKLSKDPVAALLELNETEHFLTRSVMDQVEALARQGDTMGATEAAIGALSDTTKERAAAMAGDVDHLERAWRGLKSTIAGVWDDIRGVFRDGPSQQIRELESNIRGLREGGGVYQGLSDAARQRLIAKFEADIKAIREASAKAGRGAAGGTAVDSEAERKRIREREDAERSWAAAVQANLSAEARHRADINRIREDGAKLGKSEAQIQAQIAAAEARFAASQAKRRAISGRAPRAPQISEEDRALARLNSQYQSSAASLEREIALFGDRSRAAAMAYDIQAAGLDKVNPKLAEANMEAARWRDWLDEMAAIEGVWEDVAADHGKMAAKVKGDLDGMTVAAQQAGRNMQDAFADFLFDPFKDGVDGLLENFGKMLQRMAAEMAASQVFKMLGNWGAANAGAGGWQGAVAGVFSSMFGAPKANAKGGVYASPSLSAYSGEIVDKPTLFAFAKGAGLMGEAGPEAIMPLRRGPDGRLGVAAAGGAANVTVNIHNAPAGADVQTRRNSDGGMDIDVIFKQLEGRFAGNVASGTGPLYAAQKGRFGLRDAI